MGGVLGDLVTPFSSHSALSPPSLALDIPSNDHFEAGCQVVLNSVGGSSARAECRAFVWRADIEDDVPGARSSPSASESSSPTQQYKIQQEPRLLRWDGDGALPPEKTESYSDVKAALTDCGCAAGGVGGQRTGTTRVCANCTACVRA